ncbi:MAG: ABC transporter permease [Phycisphaerales bacterium]
MWLLQTRALLVDAYRELNAKKMFWIVMVISALIMGAIACLGVYEGGMSVLWWKFDNPVINAVTMPPEVFYKLTFVSFAIPVWLAWGATILALISTASMIPDFVSGGSIELSLAKPIGRIRLFLTKYLCGLLFVVLQVGVFSLGAFLVIGLRGGAWEPGLFLAVPLITVFFSYLFCVCALVGLLTRSTIAALLLTMLFWLLLFAVNTTDGIMLTFDTRAQMTVQRHEERIERFRELGPQRDAALNAYRDAMASAGLGDAFEAPPLPAEQASEPPVEGESEPSDGSVDERGAFVEGVWIPAAPSDNAELRRLQREAESMQNRWARSQRYIENTVEPGLEAARRSAEDWSRWQGIIFASKTALPKTSETIELLRRWVVSAAELPTFDEQGEGGGPDMNEQALFGGMRSPGSLEVDTSSSEFNEAVRERYDARSVWWVLGTSLAFQFVVLGIACGIFSRRDF